MYLFLLLGKGVYKREETCEGKANSRILEKKRFILIKGDMRESGSLEAKYEEMRAGSRILHRTVGFIQFGVSTGWLH